MGNITIFEEPSDLPTVRRQSKLLDKMGTSLSLRRIATNTNGTFKRMVSGEQIGKAVPHSLDVIIVDLLPEVSRQFYAADYNPEAKPTAPDCWSNLGDKPEPKAANKQGTSCATCPKNVDGSGKNGRGKACRHLRRVAVLVAGDPSGDVYQMQFAAMSLFGKGVDNTHPFESYKKFLMANGEGVDTVVTRVQYDLEADTMKLKFTPVRHLTPVEAGLVDAAQADPETQKYIGMTVAEMDGAKTTAPAQPKLFDATAEVVATKPKPAPKAGNPFEDEEAEAEAAPEEAAPTVTKRKPKVTAEVAPEVKSKLASVVAGWADDDEDEE